MEEGSMMVMVIVMVRGKEKGKVKTGVCSQRIDR